MGEKILLGCAYCGKDKDVDLTICCRHHVRLVCAGCTETPGFLAEHAVAEAS